MPAPYCHPLDVLRRFEPSLTLDDLAAGNPIGLQSVEQIQARIRSVSQDWDQDTGTPLRLRRTGTPDAPRTYEYHDASRGTGGFPLQIELDHDDIVPLDSSAGDALEVRTGRDSWDDITAAEGDDWVLNHSGGYLKLFRILIQRVYWEAPDERYLRATYRYGSLGGDRERGGETTLDADITDTETTLSVSDASRLPPDGGIVLLTAADPANSEYVRITDVDWDTDELTVQRGANGTTKSSHDSGDVVHYCPEDVRDAVAAQAAAELVTYDTSNERADGDNASVTATRKLDDWQQEWQHTKAQYSAVRRM